MGAHHRAKKRRSEALESPDPEATAGISLPPSANAPDPNPPGAGGDQFHRQEPDPGAGGGEEEDGMDHISRLPDAVLGEVISLLPTKDAARTQTLASRWRHLWRSAPLNLDCGELIPGRRIFAGVVSRILSAHRGPGRRFRAPAALVLDRPATLDAWLRSPALDNLEEIDFWADYFAPVMLESPPPPASMFRFASCLGVITLSKCHLSVDITQTIRINSSSLKSIGLSSQHHEDVTRLVEFIIEDAPCLERFIYLQQRMSLRVSVITAPKLETLGPLCDLDIDSRLAFGSMIIQPSFVMGLPKHAINSTIPVWSVKSLAFDILTLSLDVIIDFMRCFPYLEKLYIQSLQGGDNNLWHRKHSNLIRCLDIRLKTIVLNNYRGIKSQVNFATFFVLNAKMLESMRFYGGCYNENKRFLADQHRLLQLEKRASRDARFYFTSNRCEHNFVHINHACDLSTTDPFECVGTGVGVCASFE
ncbi:unnamed protein product [Urochloa decumbens]|uniref:F-box domain-containing protein n=1 Tax=Urochloa decumbens TaxID=240449 RepID=A0ABC9FQL5_9POAL